MQRPPGLLRLGVNPDVVMMICTAGHVDHGKTALVKMLTGCNTDRLKVEQERGMTIELGFAPCILGGELCVGIVDVPGHEKFVKNMVAGVSGIDMTILVIAADDGIMPQTIEHLQIMQLLGVRQGIVALTKTDLVAPERTEQLTKSIAEFLAGTFLDGARIYPVSSETGDGYFAFYDALVAEIKGLVRKRKQGIFRMPIERVFAQKGFGVVVTGIPVDGAIEVGAQVEVVPGNQAGKVRGIQRFLRDASEGGYGQCLALNIPDFSKAPPVRGQVLSLPGYLKAASCFHVQLHTVSGLEPPLRNAEAIKFHTGTTEEIGKVYLLEEKVLEANRTAPATVVTEQPVAAAVHDRFILRRASPAATVAGGDILVVSQEEHRPKRKQLLDQLNAYLDFFRGADLAGEEGMTRRVEHCLRFERTLGASKKDLSKGVLLPEAAVAECLARLDKDGKAFELQPDYYIHSEAYGFCLSQAEKRVQEAGGAHQALSLTVGELRAGMDWPAPVWNRVLADLTKKGAVALRGSKVLLQSSAEKLDPADRDLRDRILALFEETGFASPRPDEVPGRLGAPAAKVDRLLDYLCNEGRLVRLSKNVVLSYNALKEAQDRVVRVITENGMLDSADFKTVIGSTRKYALAILDYLDARHVTVRFDNVRKLAPNHQKNLI